MFYSTLSAEATALKHQQIYEKRCRTSLPKDGQSAAEFLAANGLTRGHTSLVRHVHYASSVADESKMQRSLKATAQFAVGDIVLATPAAVHPVIHEEFVKRKCSFCFGLQFVFSLEHNTSKDSLRRCAKCHFAHYCSKECQVADWKSNHKIECEAIASLRNKSFGSLEQLLLCGRVLRKFGRNDNDGIPELDSPWSMIHHAPLPVAEKDDKISLLSELRRFSLVPEEITETDIVDMMQKFQANNFSIASDKSNAIAEGCFPIAALANHSCVPNTVLNYVLVADKNPKHLQVVLEFRAIEVIQPGDEIRHCYVDLLRPAEERKLYLNHVHRFECCCSRHELEPQKREVVSNLDSELEKANKLFAEAMLCENPDTECDKLNEVFIKKLQLLGRYHPETMQVAQLVIAIAIETDIFALAYEVCSLVVSVYQRTYGTHSITADQLLMLAEIEMRKGTPCSKVLETLNEAETMYTICQGEHSWWVSIVRQTKLQLDLLQRQ